MAIWLAISLAIASALCEALVWSFFGGFDGCGASFNPTSRWVFEYAPFLLVALSAVILTFAGLIARWRWATVIPAVLTAIGIGTLLEVLVFLTEFGDHRCGE